jgi:hypothetical protein
VPVAHPHGAEQVEIEHPRPVVVAEADALRATGDDGHTAGEIEIHAR